MVDSGKPANRLWIALGLVMALLASVVNLEHIVRLSLGSPGTGQVAEATPAVQQAGGVRTAMSLATARDFGQGYMKIHDLAPTSPLARAGAVNGDHMRYDYASDQSRELHAGEKIGLTIDHGGIRRHVVLTAEPFASARDEIFAMAEIIFCAILMCSVLTGLFIVLRSQGKLTLIVLGMAFMAFGERGSTAGFTLVHTSALFIPLSIPQTLILRAMPVLFLIFAIRFYRETTGAQARWMTPAAAGYGVLAMVSGLLYSHASLNVANLPLIGNATALYTTSFFAGLVLTALVLCLGLSRAEAGTRPRYVLMIIAIVMVILARGINWIESLFIADFHHGFFLLDLNDPFSILQAVLALAGPLVFAYAVLRHRLLDLGFAVNRTLVYGVLSFAILLVFGLAEWGIEKLLPESVFEGHSEQIKMLVEAAIALSIFLVFHRVRDFVEHHIEKLFFRQWHEKEAALKRFVKEAGFILKSEPLTAGFVAALGRFSDGAACALYRVDENGNYNRAEGELPGVAASIDADDPFMVTLRTDRAAFEPAGNGIALVLPMIHRTEVVGVVLMGRKASGFAYRPDEREVLAWAAHQIGLDLHALQVEDLQKRVAVQEIELKTLRGVRTRKAASA